DHAYQEQLLTQYWTSPRTLDGPAWRGHLFCVRLRGCGNLPVAGRRSITASNNKDAKGETLMIHPLRAAVLACAIAIVATPASAQDYPSRTVKLIVPFGAGGPA